MSYSANLDYPLSKVTTLEIGGPAKEFFYAETEEELKDLIDLAIQEDDKFLVMGGGSNLLVSDKGISFRILKNEVSGIIREGSILKVKSGTILQDLVDYSVMVSLAGLHKLTGIPGTVGGAVYGNAGAYGQTISDHLEKVVCYNKGDILTLDNKQCNFNYRDSGFKRHRYTILEVHFKLIPSNSTKLQAEAVETLEKRLVKYPPGVKCPGSFFKNIVANTLPKEILNNIPPEKIVYGKLPAGSLLEMVGAKGDQLGQIKIADYHANLFINLGGGKAQDFYNLASKYAQKVKARFGISLEPEVQLINLPSL